MTTADLLEATDERESILARLMLAYRLSRVEAEYMLETFGDGEPTNGSGHVTSDDVG